MSVVGMHLLPKPLGLIGRCRSARRQGNGVDCSGRTHGAKSLVPIRYSSKRGVEYDSVVHHGHGCHGCEYPDQVRFFRGA